MTFVSPGARRLGFHEARPFSYHDTQIANALPMQEVEGTRYDLLDQVHFVESATIGSRAGPSTEIPRAADFTASQVLTHPASGNTILDFRNSNFTVLVVCNFDAVTSTHYLWTHWDTSSQRSIGLMRSSSSTAFIAAWSTDGTSSTTAVHATDPSVGTWYWVWMQRDTVANTMGIAVNDGAMTTGSLSGGTALHNSTASLQIGEADFDGAIAQVVYWDSVLPTTHRSNIYNSGNGRALVRI